MSALAEVRENFRFMVSEVTSQVEMTQDFTLNPSRELVEKIFSGDDYIDTLKSLIEEKTFEMLMATQPVNKRQVAMLRALNTITSNLERIADFAVNIPRQMSHLKDSSFVQDFHLERAFGEVVSGLGFIVPAVEKADTGLAYKICNSEFELDNMYAETFARILEELAAGGESGDLVTTLHIANYLERMGDSLLNIGEAILFAVVGEKMKIHQYRALSESLATSGEEAPISQIEFESIWGTRSGCRIGTVQRQAMEESRRPVLFKHGNYKKLEQERNNVNRWEDLLPGVPPKIWDFQKTTKTRGSVLMEYLSGCTLQDLVINGSEAEMDSALSELEDTLGAPGI
jgi:phosphate uptake regulator